MPGSASGCLAGSAQVSIRCKCEERIPASPATTRKRSTPGLRIWRSRRPIGRAPSRSAEHHSIAELRAPSDAPGELPCAVYLGEEVTPGLRGARVSLSGSLNLTGRAAVAQQHPVGRRQQRPYMKQAARWWRTSRCVCRLR